MYRYLLLNRNKLGGISFVFFILSALICISNKRVDIDIILVSAGLTIFVFALLFADGYLTYKRKVSSFNWPAFQDLKERGFTEELTAYQSKFIFTDKRLSGYVDDYLVRVDGSRKKLGIMIGIDYAGVKDDLSRITTQFKEQGILINDLFIEKEIQQVYVQPEMDLYGMITGLTMFLRENGIAPEKQSQPG